MTTRPTRKSATPEPSSPRNHLAPRDQLAEGEYLTMQVVAAHFGVTESFLRKKISTGELFRHDPMIDNGP